MKRKRIGERWSKQELVSLLERRGHVATSAANRQRKYDELNQMVGPLSHEEQEWLRKLRRQSHATLKTTSTEALQKTLVLAGLGRGSALGKAGMASLICQKNLTVWKPQGLDPDQSALIEHVLRQTTPMTLVVGSGGSGKSKSLAEAAARLTKKDPAAKILIVMFNVAAEKVMKQRIQLADGKFGVKLEDPWSPPAGITCLTFNKLAHRIISRCDPSAAIELDDQIPAAVERMTQRPLGRNTWTLLIVDECQDVCGRYTDFVQTLCNASGRCLIAGDGKQELYNGAQFFSRLWAFGAGENTQRMILGYNHRSHPAIVQMLNSYSEFCFPSLHHTQIVARKTDEKTEGGVSLLLVDKRPDMAQAIVSEMLRYPPEDVLLIAPITIEKFNLGDLMLEIRNLLSAAGSVYPFSSLIENMRYEPHDSVYYAGSSKKLKGTEKKVVILLGGDPLCLDYGITDTEYRKCLYVAISRAQERLIVVLDKGTKIERQSPLGQVIAHAKEDYTFQLRTFQPAKHLRYVRVRDDLSNARFLSVNPATEDSCPVFHSSQIKHNEDFMGLLVEALLALRLEDPFSQPVTRPWRAILRRQEDGHYPNIWHQSNPHMHGFHELQPNSEYRLYLKSTESRLPPAQLLELSESKNLVDVAYVLTVLNFTSRIGRWWVASAQVLDLVRGLGHLDEFVQQLPVLLRLENRPLRSWGRPVRRTDQCVRSTQDTCEIVGCADLEFDDLVVEVKFAHHANAHLTQTALYCDLLSKPGLLVNLLEGKVFGVSNELVSQFRARIDAQARSWLALKNGYSLKRFKRLKLDDATIEGALFVVLDVETHGFPPNGLLLEVAACAFFAGTSDIESVFFEQASNVAVDPNAFCGLSPVASVGDEPQRQLRAQAHHWRTGLRGRAIAVVWGGCDDVKAAGLQFDRVIDLRRLYLRFLELNQIRRHASTTLSDAVEHIFGTHDVLFHAHRALDDVIATVFVLAAILDLGGVL